MGYINIEKVGLKQYLGADRYELLVNCISMDVSKAETARKLKVSRNRLYRYLDIYDAERLQSNR